MRIEISYERVSTDPQLAQAFAEAKAKKAKSKAKSASAPLEECKWILCIAERIDGPIPWDETLKQAMARRIPRLLVHLQASYGRGWWNAATSISPTSDVVVEVIKKQEEENAAEKARVAALTDTEREGEIQEALSALRGSPGFMGLQVPTSTLDKIRGVK
jgi:hypothetical protein